MKNSIEVLLHSLEKKVIYQDKTKTKYQILNT